jgi:biopolymer transport protein ExbD
VNFQRGTARDEPEINLIPLIDVLLVVVIFLVVTTTYARFAELQINLPEAQGDTAKEIPTQIAIGVDASGHYRVNEIVVQSQDVQSLADALLKAANGRKDSAIVISADAQATHQSVVRVMDAARRVGLNRVTFVTQTTASDTP